MLKEIAIRIFIYPFCVFLFYLSYKMTFESLNYSNIIYESKAFIYGPIGMILALVYPFTDILIALKKIFKKKNDNSK